MHYTVFYPTVETTGVQFDSIRARHCQTLDEARTFMRLRIARFVDTLTDAPANDGWRVQAQIVLGRIDGLAEPAGRGERDPYWTVQQGAGGDGIVTFLSPAPSIWIKASY